MPQSNRRLFLGHVAFGAGALASASARADGQDGHAAGHDVAPAREHMVTIPRKPGDAVTFTASLDRAPLKATTGGWARDVTARQLPIATGLAGAHLFLNPGGLREMHWHSSAEWAYILDGSCQVTVVDPSGETEIANYGAGDLWYFPHGHAHSIQTIGAEPCHAILVFNDGLYSEHGTFGLTDWMSRLEPRAVTQAFGIGPDDFHSFPPAEAYIKQGPVLAPGGPEANCSHELDPGRSHRHALMDRPSLVSLPGGTIHVASASEFPLSTAMTGVVTRLEPGAMHAPHWHPEANEWHYLAAGRTRVTLFGPDKRMAVAELAAGDCAYLPRGCGHLVENIGAEPCEMVGVLDDGAYVEARLADWLSRAPRHALAANLGLDSSLLARWSPSRDAIIPAL